MGDGKGVFGMGTGPVLGQSLHPVAIAMVPLFSLGPGPRSKAAGKAARSSNPSATFLSGRQAQLTAGQPQHQDGEVHHGLLWVSCGTFWRWSRVRWDRIARLPLAQLQELVGEEGG